MNLRTCSECGKTYPFTDKYFYSFKKGDKRFYRHQCKRCYMLKVKGVSESDVFREDFCSRCGIRFGGKIKNAQRSQINDMCTECYKQLYG